jgi:hypothetical protein
MPSTVSDSSTTAQVTVSAARECEWSAQAAASWISIAPSAGRGNATLTVRVDENPRPDSREGTVRVNDVVISFTQRERPCQYRVGSHEVSVDRDGGRFAVSVETAEACGWSVSSGESWVQVASATGTGPGNAEFVVDRNSGAERSAALEVAGNTIRLRQATGERPPAPPAPAPPPTTTPPSPVAPPAPAPRPTPAPTPPPSLLPVPLPIPLPIPLPGVVEPVDQDDDDKGKKGRKGDDDRKERKGRDEDGKEND